MSQTQKYNWTADGSYLPPIPLYAKIKHLVAQEYIKNWIEVLCGHGKFGVKTVTLVDGFCGGGMYRDGDELWEGSAIRMIRMVEAGLKTVRERKSYHQLDAEFIFIDAEREHTDCLKLQLKNKGFEHYLKSGTCQIINNKFEEELPNIIRRIGERKGFSFFFLDPYGLAVTPEIVRQIIALGKSEILFNYMVSGLERIISRTDNIHRKILKDFAVDRYYEDYQFFGDTRDILAKQAYLRNQSLLLYRQEGQVKYAWTFAIMRNKSVFYYLIHLSSNPKALEVMKCTLQKYNNLEYQYHYGVYGLGFREVEYFEENLKLYDIKESNHDLCLSNLREQLCPIIYDLNDGITFQEIYHRTLQTNPATEAQYMKALTQLSMQKEIKIFRGGKLTKAKNLKPGDVIIPARDTPLWIPGLSKKF